MSQISSVSEPGKEPQCSQHGRLNVEYVGSTVWWAREPPGHDLLWVWKGLSRGCRMRKMGKSHSSKIICVKADRSIRLWDSLKNEEIKEKRTDTEFEQENCFPPVLTWSLVMTFGTRL